jgi:hypothetical protein
MHLLTFVLFALFVPSGAASSFVGTWEGESKCTVPDSPCHDEHVIYEIKPKGEAGATTIDAYKIVNGEKLFMGTIECSPAQGNTVSCHFSGKRINDWVFIQEGTKMNGTLYMDKERTVYRKIHVEKK